MAAMGRDMAKAIIRDASDEARLVYGEIVLIKRITGGSPGNPSQGISPTFSFTTTKSRAVIITLGQNDIMQSGGIYQLGDISVDLNEELEEVTDRTRGVGDRMLWRGNEYRIAGKKKNLLVSDRDHIFTYVMRKVD